MTARGKSNGVWLYVTVDSERGLALLRGEEARRVTMVLTGETVYSPGGRGWVIPERHVQDVAAYGEYLHRLVVVHSRRAT